MAVAGKVSGIYRRDGVSASFTNLLLEDLGDHKTFRVPLADTTHKYWDKFYPVTVYVNTGSGFQPTLLDYEVQHPSGYVVFTNPLPQPAQVEASGYAFPIIQVAGAFGWNLDFKQDALDATTFENDGWKTYVVAFRQFTAKVDKFWVTDAELQLFDTELLFLFFVTTKDDQARFEGWGVINSESVNVAVGELIKAPLEIQGSDAIYFRRD